MILTYGWDGWQDLFASLNPSLKYSYITGLTLTLSLVAELILRIFGLDPYAFIGLLLVFGLELTTGMQRANVQQEDLTSAKFSRFTFKLCYYLLIIAISWMMAMSFDAAGNHIPATVFRWMHNFIVIQIVLENVVSISENIAIITGKPKSHWINKLQEKINNLLK